jgi:DEAD/DEAH box helicase domain-containing protein
LLQQPKKVVVFDVETQKLAHEVGGWKNIAKMRLSLAVAHTEEYGFLTFTEVNVSELVELLQGADLVVGFNHVRFDYEVLSAYTAARLRALPNLDILLHVKAALGFRLKLDHLAEFTLGKKKSGDGLDAARWFREGRMDLIEQYCRDDVAITRDLYRFGLEHGHLLYRRDGHGVSEVPVDWRQSVGCPSDRRHDSSTGNTWGSPAGRGVRPTGK